MTGTHQISCDSIETPVNALSARNKVRELQERIAKAFRRDASAHAAAGTDCLAVVERFLSLTGWVQGARRIFESLPHADDMSSVFAFRTVLYRLGFSSHAEEASAENLRQEYLPCFLRYPDGAIKLAERKTREGEVVIFDPQFERHERVRIDEIEALAIFPERIEDSEVHGAAGQQSWTSQILSAFAPHIRQIFTLSFIINLFALAPPVFVMSVYDKAIATKSFDVLAGLTVGIAVIVAGDFALRIIRVRLQAYFGARLDEQLNETAFRHLLHLSLSHTEDAPIGSQLTRLRQMTSLHEAFTGPLAIAIFDLPFIALFLFVIAVIGGNLVWAPIALIAIYALIAAWAVPRTGSLLRKAGESRSQLSNLTTEALTCQRAINDLAAEHIWIRRYRKLSAEAAFTNMKSRQMNFLLQTISQSMVAVAGVGVLAVGVSMVLEGTLSSGALIAVMALSWRVLGPIRSIFLSSLTLGQTLQSLQQVDRLVRLPLERNPNSGPTIPRSFKGNIVVDRVSFRYAGQKEPTLRGVSLEAKPGELTCLYGRSGSGTSTMLRVLLGLHQQQAGSIFVDGLDLRQLDKGEWRQAIGVGLQSLDLFHGTIAQNIRLAQPDASDEQIERIATRLGIDRYYGNALDLGLETRCTTMARAGWPDALLSRINLARAFIKDAPIYLLDEPAATLDHQGEKALLSIIEEKRKTSAIIMTTQRPSHMRLADKVVWMDRGMVRDIGPPDEIVPKVLAA